jgi:hypothetical protein
MRLPRVRFTVRTLLMLPPAVVLLLIAADQMTARPSYWRYGGTKALADRPCLRAS